MLTKLLIRNFKKFEEVEIELGGTVVFIGPNNCGKTAALQALALWNFGLQQWLVKRGEKTPKKRTGVALNRRDITAIPVPSLKFIWFGSHVRNVFMKDKKLDRTENINIDLVVSGFTNGKVWECGLEFDFANPESCYCRPLRISDNVTQQRMEIPEEAKIVKTAILPPMSGLADREYLKQAGEISSLIGQGQTAQVLRNLCLRVFQSENDHHWMELVHHIKDLFGITLIAPEYNPINAEISMSYKDSSGIVLDLSSSGRGTQQVLLLLAHLYSHPGCILLIDEPDAHLEILRQRRIYQLLTEVAAKTDSQIIIASHSEVVLNEAADRDTVIAFLGEHPFRINDRNRKEITKSLKEIGYDQYYQAEQKGWVLYLEGSTDLLHLRSLASHLKHEAYYCLDSPFVKYVANQPGKAREHFFGLRTAKNDLMGIAIFDKLSSRLESETALIEIMWRKRELENYLCKPEWLLAFARGLESDDLAEQAEAIRRVEVMQKCLEELAEAQRIKRKPEPWADTVKASDEFLDPLFSNYYEKLGLLNLMSNGDYSPTIKFLPKDQIDPEIIEKLDAIVEVAKKAKPRTD